MAGERLDHRLIMFVGTPGAGKSTLSRWLWQELTRRGVPATLPSEEAVYRLEVLAPFTEQWNRSDPGGIDTLLDAVRTLSEEWRASNTVWITDQFLPAFHWLQGKYLPERVQAYAEALARILHPLWPLLIYLTAEVHEAWQRAVEERGQDWSDWMVDLFKSREFPLYPGGPVRDLDDLLRSFVWGQSQSLALLARWPEETLVLDTTTIPLPQVKETLLQHIGLSQAARSSRQGHNPMRCETP